MLEKIAYLQNEILRAPLEVVVPAAIFLFVVLIGLVLGLWGRTRTVEHHDLEAEARRWIGDRIDEHINVLAEAYGGASASHEELPPDFVATIEPAHDLINLHVDPCRPAIGLCWRYRRRSVA